METTIKFLNDNIGIVNIIGVIIGCCGVIAVLFYKAPTMPDDYDMPDKSTN
jgi:hypothetical protein